MKAIYYLTMYKVQFIYYLAMHYFTILQRGVCCFWNGLSTEVLSQTDS